MTRAAARPRKAPPRPRKVVSAAPRLRAKARAQRRDRWRRQLTRGLWAVALVAPVVAGVWVLVGSSLLAVRTVEVEGVRRLTAAQVLAAAGVVPGTPLAKVDTGTVAERVRTLAPVASVAVDRDWPRGLRLQVVERVPVAGVRQGSGFSLVDRTGTRFATVAALPRDVVPLDAASPAALAASLTVLQGLPPALKGQLGSVRASSPEQVTLLLRGGRTVLWGGATDGRTKAQALLVLLTMPGTVFDVSAPGVVTRR